MRRCRRSGLLGCAARHLFKRLALVTRLRSALREKLCGNRQRAWNRTARGNRKQTMAAGSGGALRLRGGAAGGGERKQGNECCERDCHQRPEGTGGTWVSPVHAFSFGDRAVYLRPLALRTRLATGVPFSGCGRGVRRSPVGRMSLTPLLEPCKSSFGAIRASYSGHCGRGRMSAGRLPGLIGALPGSIQGATSVLSASIE